MEWRSSAAVITARGLGTKHIYRGGGHIDRTRRAADMFVEKALTNLLADRDIRRSHNAELKAACEKVLGDLRDGAAAAAAAAEPPQDGGAASVLPEVDATSPLDMESLFKPFELACQSRSPRMVTASLDSIQKLVAYGHIRTVAAQGCPSPSGPPPAVSPIKENAAAATAASPEKSTTPIPPGSEIGDRHFDDRVVSTVVNCFQGPQTDEGVQLQVLKALLTIVTAPGIRVHENSLLQAVRTCYNIYLASRNLINQTTAKATLNQMLSYVFQAMEAAALEAGYPDGGTGGAGKAASAGRQEEETPPVVNGGGANGSVSSEDALENDGDPEFAVAKDVVSPILDELLTNLPCLKPSMETFNIMRKDCFLVFRSLCKLSMKPLPEGTPDPKSHELRSKILSMQLILGLLQNGGPVFCTDELFVSAIKTYLCVALSQNGVSNISEVFELSLALFISLLTKYRLNLKPQIEIFFKEICLNILEAAGSSFEQKWMVLQGLYTVCCEAQIVIDIYVNYDCDLTAANIFERLVDDLSKVAQGRQAYELESSGANHLHRMRIKGLECLVSILKCMVEWSRDVYVNPHQQAEESSNGGGSESNNNMDSLKSSASMSSIAASVGDDPTRFEKVKQHKHVMEVGLRLFAQKPAKGLKYFSDQGILEGDTDDDVARFLHSEGGRLDKRALGDLLGDLDFKDVMYSYVDQMDYAGMDFVTALRQFLEGFQLPGEAQKIDRLMEKFASRYCECNPKENVFASADAAYVLAFSIIMLTTDLHSSQVWKRRTEIIYHLSEYLILAGEEKDDL